MYKKNVMLSLFVGSLVCAAAKEGDSPYLEEFREMHPQVQQAKDVKECRAILEAKYWYEGDLEGTLECSDLDSETRRLGKEMLQKLRELDTK